MPLTNRIILCAAGGGKTTGIVRQAFDEATTRSALITYTRNNEREIQSKFFALRPAIPPHVEVMTWYVFLLQELARPYRNYMHDRRIEGLCWIEGRSAQGVAASRISTHYFADHRLIYSDKIAKFICECDRLSGGAIMHRLADRFDHIFIDEVQDLAGYDLDLVELMLRAGIRMTLVGDPRQSVLSTNNSGRNEPFKGVKIVKKFQQWEQQKLASIQYEEVSHRCHQHVASLADSLFPDHPVTRSLNQTATGHDGVFIVSMSRVEHYLEIFRPQILRYDRRTLCSESSSPMNFGEAKGLSFDRVLIYPHGPATKWLRTGDPKHIKGSNTKLYVGITRARQSVAFVFSGKASVPHAQIFA